MPKLTFKKMALLELSKLENPHRLSLRSGVSYDTTLRFVNEPEKVKDIDTTVLASLLLKGLGMSEKEVLDLRLGDLFAFVDSPQD
jgi:hypothetical protein